MGDTTKVAKAVTDLWHNLALEDSPDLTSLIKVGERIAEALEQLAEGVDEGERREAGVSTPLTPAAGFMARVCRLIGTHPDWSIAQCVQQVRAEMAQEQLVALQGFYDDGTGLGYPTAGGIRLDELPVPTWTPQGLVYVHAQQRALEAEAARMENAAHTLPPILDNPPMPVPLDTLEAILRDPEVWRADDLWAHRAPEDGPPPTATNERYTIVHEPGRPPRRARD